MASSNNPVDVPGHRLGCLGKCECFREGEIARLTGVAITRHRREGTIGWAGGAPQAADVAAAPSAPGSGGITNATSSAPASARKRA